MSGLILIQGDTHAPYLLPDFPDLERATNAKQAIIDEGGILEVSVKSVSFDENMMHGA